MENFKSTISAFQKTLIGFSFKKPQDYPEEFAQLRYAKKLERPDKSTRKTRRQSCFEDWISFDYDLPRLSTPLGWYKVRDFLIRELRPCTYHDVEITNGSEFTPTRGATSIEAKLCTSEWTCTEDNFDEAARMCYNVLSLKRACKRRYVRWFRSNFGTNPTKESERILFSHFSKGKNVGFQIFKWKLRRVTTFVIGNRFSTVPKNNKVDRPICIEPFLNMLVQRSLGIHFRQELKRLLKIDLETLATEHRRRLTDRNIATIDLKNASDSISLDLIRFLFPKRIFNQIANARSSFVVTQNFSDIPYFQLNKVSSMGNGFTFELMSLILNVLCKELDNNASVFGDDIIIQNDKAPELIERLTRVGFVVNKDKSFINSKFRESCGGNFHDDFGYIESFDFLWPESIHDCVVIYNKAKRLSLKYGSFKALERSLYRAIPKALRGGPVDPVMDLREAATGVDVAISLSTFFCTGGKAPMLPYANAKVKEIRKDYQYENVVAFKGFAPVLKLRSHALRKLDPHKHWAKYLMYLFSGRVAKDSLSGSTSWSCRTYISFGKSVVELKDSLKKKKKSKPRNRRKA